MVKVSGSGLSRPTRAQIVDRLPYYHASGTSLSTSVTILILNPRQILK